MQTRKPDTRTVPPIESKTQWNTLIESIESEGDAIVESESGAKAALISYEEFLEIKEARRKWRYEEGLERLRQLEEEQALRNSDLSEEEVERIALEVGREIRESLNEKYRSGVIGFPHRDPE